MEFLRGLALGSLIGLICIRQDENQNDEEN